MPGLGHNRGPPLLDEEAEPRKADSYHRFCWKMAHAAAWKQPPYEVVMRRLRRARALGMTYREYTSLILDRGVYL